MKDEGSLGGTKRREEAREGEIKREVWCHGSEMKVGEIKREVWCHGSMRWRRDKERAMSSCGSETYGLFGSLEKEENSGEESRGEGNSYPPPCLNVLKISKGEGSN